MHLLHAISISNFKSLSFERNKGVGHGSLYSRFAQHTLQSFSQKQYYKMSTISLVETYEPFRNKISTPTSWVNVELTLPTSLNQSPSSLIYFCCSKLVQKTKFIFLLLTLIKPFPTLCNDIEETPSSQKYLH